MENKKILIWLIIFILPLITLAQSQFYQKALKYEQLGNTTQAIKYYLRAARVDRSLKAIERVVFIYYRAGKLDEIKRLFFRFDFARANIIKFLYKNNELKLVKELLKEDKNLTQNPEIAKISQQIKENEKRNILKNLNKLYNLIGKGQYIIVAKRIKEYRKIINSPEFNKILVIDYEFLGYWDLVLKILNTIQNEKFKKIHLLIAQIIQNNKNEYRYLFGLINDYINEFGFSEDIKWTLNLLMIKVLKKAIRENPNVGYEFENFLIRLLNNNKLTITDKIKVKLNLILVYLKLGEKARAKEVLTDLKNLINSITDKTLLKKYNYIANLVKNG